MDLPKMQAYVDEYEKIDCRCNCHIEDKNCYSGAPCCAIWGQRKKGDPELVAEMKKVFEKFAEINRVLEILETMDAEEFQG